MFQPGRAWAQPKVAQLQPVTLQIATITVSEPDVFCDISWDGAEDGELGALIAEQPCTSGKTKHCYKVRYDRFPGLQQLAHYYISQRIAGIGSR